MRMTRDATCSLPCIVARIVAMPPTNLTELISFYLCLFSLFWAFPKLWYSRNLKECFERALNYVLESKRGTQKTLGTTFDK